MQPLHAIVKNGRLTLDEPSDLPEGHVVVLLPLEELLSMAEDFGGDGTVALSFAPVQREWKEPKTMDAAALLDELRSL